MAKEFVFGIHVDTGSSSKDVAETSRSVDAFKEALENVDKIIKKIDPDMLKDLKVKSDAAKSVENLTDKIGDNVDTLKSQTDAMKEASSSISKYKNNNDSLSGAQSGLVTNMGNAEAATIKLTNATNQLGTSTKILAEAQEEENSILTKLFNTMSGGVNVVADMISSFRGFIAIAEKFVDPAFLERLQQVFELLSFIAGIRGNDALAEQFDNAAEAVEKWGKTVQDVKDFMSMNFLDIALRRLSAFTDKVITIGKIGTGVVGLGIVFSELGVNILGVDKSLSVLNKGFKTVGLKTFWKNVKNIGAATQGNAIPGIIGLADKSFILGTGMALLGANLRQSEDAMTSMAGTALLLGAILAGGLGIILGSILKATGELMISMGVGLADAMIEYSKLAQKAEVVTRAFEFTINNFNKAVGESAGTVAEWENVITEVMQTSAFGADQIQKAISLIVKESNVLGLSLEQNQKIIKRSADVAAATGKTIEEVATSFASGLAGNSQAVLALGINIRGTNKHMQEYSEEMGNSFENLSELEKTQVRLKTIMHDTQPLIGAAADATNTYAGANAVLERNLDQVKITLGESGTIQKQAIKLQNFFVQGLLKIDKGLLGVVGDMQDFASVGLIMVGTLTTVALKVTLFTTVLQFLQRSLEGNALMSGIMTKAFGGLGDMMGFQAVEVTSLAGVWTNLSMVIKRGAMSIGASIVGTFAQMQATMVPMVPAIIAVGKAWAFATLKAGILVIAVVGIWEAIQEFRKVLGPVGNEMLDWVESLLLVTVTLTVFNKLIVISTALQVALTFVMARLAGMMGVQGVAVTSLSGLYANFILMSRAMIATLAKGLIPAMVAAAGAIKAFALAAMAALIPLIPLILKIGVIVAIAVALISAVDDMSSSFEGFGGAVSDIMLPLAQMVGLAEETTEGLDKLGSQAKETTGFFESLWNMLKGAIQLVILPFGLALLALGEGLLQLKLALTDDEVAVQQLTDALERNDESQMRLVGQMVASTVAVTSLGDNSEIAAAEAQILSTSFTNAGDAIAEAGHKSTLTAEQLEDLTGSLKGAIKEIQNIEKEMAKVGKSDIAIIKSSAAARVTELAALQERLDKAGEITDEEKKQVKNLQDLINEQANLNIEGLKAEELNKLQKESEKLERNLTKSKLTGADAISKQLEFTLADLDAKKEKLRAEDSLTKEIEAQIDKQKELAKATELVSIASLASRGAKKGRTGPKPKGPKKVKPASLSDAQQDFKSLLGDASRLEQEIAEFGKKGADLINLRKDRRIGELKTLQETLETEKKLTGSGAQVINLAKAREIKLANLKLAEEQSKAQNIINEKDKKALEEKARLGQSIAEKLKQSDKDLAGRSNSRIQMIRMEAVEKHKGIQLDIAAAEAADQMTPQLRRNFKQLQKNNLEAGKFDIAEIKTDSIEQLRKDTEALVMEGKTDEEQKKFAMEQALAALEVKRAELKAADLLTKEAEKLLAIQGKEIKKQGKPKDDGGIDFGAMGDSIADGFSQGADAIAGAFDQVGSLMDSLASFGGEDAAIALTNTMESFPEMIAKGMEALPDIIIAAVDSFVDGMDQMIAKMPEMITKILDALPEIINKLFAAFGRLVDSLPAMFAQIMDALPDIMVQIMEKLPDMILKIFNAIGDMIAILLDSLPDIIVKFAENIGPIVTALVDGIISNIGKIVIALIDSFIIKGGVIKIAVALIKAIANLIPAILKGLASALKNIFKGLNTGFKIPLEVPPAIKELPDKLKNAVSSIGEGIKAGGGDVFALVDLAKSKSAKTLDRSIGEATKRSAALFKQTFKTIGGWLQKLWAELKRIWDTVLMWLQKLWDIIEGVWDLVVIALQALWDAIELIWDTVVELLQGLWDAIELIWDNVVIALQTLWDAIELIWDNVVIAVQLLWDNVEKIFTDFVEGVQAVWDWFKENILDKFAEGVQAVWDWFKTNILDKFASGIQAVFDTLATKGQEAADKISGAINRFPEQARQAAVKISGAITQLPEQARQAAAKLAGAISALPGKATDFANNVITKLGGIGTTMWNSFTSAFGNMGGVIKNHATWAFDELFRNIKGGFGKMFEGVGGGGTKTIEKLMGTDVPVLSFARGGIVPGTATVPGNSIKNDTVASFLSPDEAVIPRSIMAQAENKRIIEAMLAGELQFRHGWHPHKKSVPTVSAPKLPTINDVKNLSPADLAKNLESNFEALKNLATGDLWDMFKDKIFGKVREMMEGVVKNAAGFEDGGVVPNTGMAMVHQDEAVLPSGLVDAIMGNSVNNQSQKQNITLNATVNMVGSDVTGGKQSGKKIIDEMFAELRKRSANQKVMHQSGLIA